MEIWREAFALCDRLSELEDAAREAELELLRNSRPELHAHLLKLLRESAEEGGPLSQLIAQAHEATNRLPPERAFQAGTVLGVYQLERILGEGGMGQVWQARRTDGRLQGPVAVKVLHSHLSRPGLHEQFAREGQIASRLSHPNIARLFDAGVTADSVPYLVFEYVSGDRIDLWCDERALDVTARVRLFLSVCRAVAAAHAQLIVHRDLKPSNILVTSEGQIKLLDFSIAKLMEEGQKTLPTELTQLGYRALTPEYAAPEQVLGQTITTATDVYSLGVLLYLLLTGLRPYGNGPTTAARLEREVVELDPRPLSQATGHTEAECRHKPEERAARRQSTPARLGKVLAGDLDTIVRKALKKLPAERYPSVAELADDLQRFLEYQPVLARPDTVRYRAIKFVRRNRAVTAAAVLVFVVVAAGIVAVSWEASQARQQARRATAVNDFLLDIFKHNATNNPYGDAAQKTTAAQLLALGAQNIRVQLRDVPDTRAELLGTMGHLYSDLGMHEEAAALLREELTTLQQMPGRPRDAAIARAEVDLGDVSMSASHLDASNRFLQQAIATLDAIGDHDSITRVRAELTLCRNAYALLPAADLTAQRHCSEALAMLKASHPDDPMIVQVLVSLGHVAENAVDYPLAEARYREALRRAMELSKGVEGHDYLAQAQFELGDFLERQQKLSESEPHLRAAIRQYVEIAGDDTLLAVHSRQSLASVLEDNGRPAESEALLRETLAQVERTLGPDDQEWATPLRRELSGLEYRRGELEAAEPLLLSSIAMAANGEGKNALSRATDQFYYGRVMTEEGRWDAATESLRKSDAYYQQMYGSNDSTSIQSRIALAQVTLGRGDVVGAGKVFREVRTAASANIDDAATEFALASWNLVDAQVEAGQVADAVVTGRSALGRIAQLKGIDVGARHRSRLHLWLGIALERDGKASEALPELQQALEISERIDDANSPWLSRVRIAAADCYIDLKQFSEARRMLALAAESQAAHPHLSPLFTAPLHAATKRLAAVSQ